jgi:hypothetical protein
MVKNVAKVVFLGVVTLCLVVLAYKVGSWVLLNGGQLVAFCVSPLPELFAGFFLICAFIIMLIVCVTCGIAFVWGTVSWLSERLFPSPEKETEELQKSQVKERQEEETRKIAFEATTLERLKRARGYKTAYEYRLLFPAACARCLSRRFYYVVIIDEPLTDGAPPWAKSKLVYEFCERCGRQSMGCSAGFGLSPYQVITAAEPDQQIDLPGVKRTHRVIRTECLLPGLGEFSKDIPEWPWDGVSLDPHEWFVTVDGFMVPSPAGLPREKAICNPDNYVSKKEACACKECQCNTLEAIVWNCCDPNYVGTEKEWYFFAWYRPQFFCMKCGKRQKCPDQLEYISVEKGVQHILKNDIRFDEYPEHYLIVWYKFTVNRLVQTSD